MLGAVLIDQEKVHLAADVAKYGKLLGPAHSFTSGMDDAFLLSVPVAVAAFLLSFLLKELKLRTSVGNQAPVEG